MSEQLRQKIHQSRNYRSAETIKEGIDKKVVRVSYRKWFRVVEGLVDIEKETLFIEGTL